LTEVQLNKRLIFNLANVQANINLRDENFREVQEQALYQSVKEASNDEKARKVIFGNTEAAIAEDNLAR
jgi:hypothetical protein